MIRRGGNIPVKDIFDAVDPKWILLRKIFYQNIPEPTGTAEYIPANREQDNDNKECI